MKIYKHDPNGLFIGESDARKNPVEDGKYLIPANATKTKPPQRGANEVAKLKGDVWTVIPDFRGTKYWPALAKFGEAPVEINEAGIKPPEDALFEEPGEPIETKVNRLKSEVMENYGEIKNKFAPPGLSDMYQIKVEAASDILKSKAPSSESITVLEPEAIARGITVKELATSVLEKSTEAKKAAGIIEAARYAANRIIDEIVDGATYETAIVALQTMKSKLSKQFGISETHPNKQIETKGK